MTLIVYHKEFLQHEQNKGFFTVSIIIEKDYMKNKLMCLLSIIATEVAVNIYFMKIDRPYFPKVYWCI